ncbi:DNA-binding protein [Pontibacillus halophilus JSM 076056 = DSM 19796]|uniref:DNA-binding protein n=1 Tax=Pontibacillus halophilus JSM 076056 = DSM 19796 TaxID=1385510 RepID=A0A0A5I9D7_9BACI|nr:hypothetical protein [Pontibacillus halophilus]KGX92447.1 DNA-binding protein [Pontibacillus halophilus JSM 076056 = DSM 19796]
MEIKLDRLTFQFADVIQEDRESERDTFRENTLSLEELHHFGRGPFCRFSVKEALREVAGTIVLIKGRTVVFVQYIEDIGGYLTDRIGNITEADISRGGDQEACRINMHFQEAFASGESIWLFVNYSEEGEHIAPFLRGRYQPVWDNLNHEVDFKEPNRPYVNYGGKEQSKYAPLRHYLSWQDEVSNYLSFMEIEDLLESSLPRSAYRLRSWWSNERNKGHTQAAGWQEAGYVVDFIHLGHYALFVHEHKRDPQAKGMEEMVSQHYLNHLTSIGKVYEAQVLPEKEYVKQLHKKINNVWTDYMAEVEDEPSLMHLQEMMLILEALAYHHGMDREELHQAMLVRRNERGGYEKGIQLQQLFDPF